MTSVFSVAPEREELLRSFERVRSTTDALTLPLEPEDMVVQTMPDVSPTKWHLAHTTWFFETLVLARSGADYSLFDRRFPALFNSYYQSLGQPYPRADRGLLSRPTVAEIRAYREHVDRALTELLSEGRNELIDRLAPAITIGLQHEEQHQELLLMDVKHVLGGNPLDPVYAEAPRRPVTPVQPMEYRAFAGGQVELGSNAEGFAFDNERPRHTVFLQPFELASRPVSAGEFRNFMIDGGYERPELWLADGWEFVQREGWRAPLYWREDGESWSLSTLGGAREIDHAEPVCHVSYFEADAFANWAGCRLPNEAEWEHAAAGHSLAGTFLESGALHPRPMDSRRGGEALSQLFGDVWEWTSSPYAPYPGYEPFEGELGEYNGKFMISQQVLRGGSCVTPERHIRPTYRNFYYPHQRWLFAGFRLARSRGSARASAVRPGPS